MQIEATRISWYFKVINNLIRYQLDNSLKDEDLTKVQYEVLLYVDNCTRRDSRVIQRDLENHFHISNPSVSNMISRLESKELIERISEGEDRRKRYLVLTPKADRLLNETYQSLRDFEAQMLEGFSPEELDAGVLFLQRILSNLTGKEDIDFDFNTCEADQTV